MKQPFYVKFWGVRGTIPTPDLSMMRYGGNTSCVEVRCGDVIIALDAGTGILPMLEQNDISSLHLLLSHTHIDHVMGLPCIRKLFNPNFVMDIWAGHLTPESFVYDALQQLISPPIFPIPFNAFPARIHFHDFIAGHPLQHDAFKHHNITIHTLSLNHPDKATAYRIEYHGGSVCYVTDTEHVQGVCDEILCAFIAKCDLFIYDSTYDDRDFTSHIGWGHSTWQHAIRLGKKAHVGKVVMFHHDPTSTDEILDGRQAEITGDATEFATFAREGMIFQL